MLGDSECAIASYEESLAVRRRIGDMSRVSLSLANVALMAVLNGDLTRGSALFAESAQIAAGIGDKRHMCFASDGLAWIAFVERRWEEADTHSRLSLRLARELGMTSMLVGGIVCLGAIAAATGDAARAARLTAAAEPHRSLTESEQVLAEAGFQAASLSSAKAASDKQVWDRAWAEGHAMSLDQAADYALSSV